jgi:hypothetical protein
MTNTFIANCTGIKPTTVSVYTKLFFNLGLFDRQVEINGIDDSKYVVDFLSNKNVKHIANYVSLVNADVYMYEIIDKINQFKHYLSNKSHSTSLMRMNSTDFVNIFGFDNARRSFDIKHLFAQYKKSANKDNVTCEYTQEMRIHSHLYQEQIDFINDPKNKQEVQYMLKLRQTDNQNLSEDDIKQKEKYQSIYEDKYLGRTFCIAIDSTRFESNEEHINCLFDMNMYSYSKYTTYILKDVKRILNELNNKIFNPLTNKDEKHIQKLQEYKYNIEKLLF